MTGISNLDSAIEQGVIIHYSGIYVKNPSYGVPVSSSLIYTDTSDFSVSLYIDEMVNVPDNSNILFLQADDYTVYSEMTCGLFLMVHKGIK